MHPPSLKPMSWQSYAFVCLLAVREINGVLEICVPLSEICPLVVESTLRRYPAVRHLSLPPLHMQAKRVLSELPKASPHLCGVYLQLSGAMGEDMAKSILKENDRAMKKAIRTLKKSRADIKRLAHEEKYGYMHPSSPSSSKHVCRFGGHLLGSNLHPQRVLSSPGRMNLTIFATIAISNSKKRAFKQTGAYWGRRIGMVETANLKGCRTVLCIVY